jgi:hypothetical protein
MSEPTVFGFEKPLAVQLKNLANGQSQVTGPPARNIEQRRVALVFTTGISAASGTTPSTAVITICEISSSNVITTTTIEETGYNIDCTAIPECYTTAEREYVSGKWIVNPPPITDLRLDGSNLQYKRGCTWTTWTTGTSCP